MRRHYSNNGWCEAELCVGQASYTADVGLSGGLLFEEKKKRSLIYNDDPENNGKILKH